MRVVKQRVQPQCFGLRISAQFIGRLRVKRSRNLATLGLSTIRPPIPRAIRNPLVTIQQVSIFGLLPDKNRLWKIYLPVMLVPRNTIRGVVTIVLIPELSNHLRPGQQFSCVAIYEITHITPPNRRRSDPHLRCIRQYIRLQYAHCNTLDRCRWFSPPELQAARGI